LEEQKKRRVTSCLGKAVKGRDGMGFMRREEGVFTEGRKMTRREEREELPFGGRKVQ